MLEIFASNFLQKMEETDNNQDAQPSPLAVIKSVFDDFNLSGLPDDIYVRVLDIISSNL